jgi:hypothetical protein
VSNINAEGGSIRIDLQVLNASANLAGNNIIPHKNPDGKSPLSIFVTRPDDDQLGSRNM